MWWLQLCLDGGEGEHSSPLFWCGGIFFRILHGECTASKSKNGYGINHFVSETSFCWLYNQMTDSSVIASYIGNAFHFSEIVGCCKWLHGTWLLLVFILVLIFTNVKVIREIYFWYWTCIVVSFHLIKILNLFGTETHADKILSLRFPHRTVSFSL